ncbi:hypothetical protein FRC04_002366 [Tulasnella sp. 424]|nr:hypothetical protein FRC04_002366 [Tulasnella sp. 424]KAG8977439.1 hypothetical protein FRC05_001837 [Tulasnella sp. 425]
MGRRLAATTLLLGALCSSASAFYLPGAAPKDYALGDQVPVYVNALTPVIAANAKLKSMMNYDYYNPQFHFCTPDDGVKRQSESLGSILFGDRIFNSPYKLYMGKNSTCTTLCKAAVPPADAKFINERILEDQAINWLVDGLPASELKQDPKSGDIFYDMGFNLGNDDDEYAEKPILNNHYDIKMEYHTKDEKNFRVVGVLVWPFSLASQSSDKPNCDTMAANPPPLYLSESKTNEFFYTYTVTWSRSDTPWATRWDNYLHIFDPKIHWFSLVNSIVIVVFLCVMVSMILLRTVSRDISRYNAIDLSEDIQEDYGWKLVHGEVFRQPWNPGLLAVLSGNVFALLGFLSPSNRGSLATVMMICWTFFGFVSGYISSRVYLSLGGTDKRNAAFFTATLLPTFVFVVVFLLDLFLVFAGSSGAVPFGTMLIIVILWFGINAPLTVIGFFVGARHGPVSNPVSVNQIPRQIPPPPKYLRPWAATLIGGILPFGAAFVELYFVLSSLFASRAYYAFGFLALTAGVVALTTATVSILFTYFMLCAEEYRWQWRSFFVGGGSSAWILLYGLFYWASRLSLDSMTSAILYMGYLFLIALLNFLVTGTIGFLASYWAVRRLYSAIRID